MNSHIAVYRGWISHPRGLGVGKGSKEGGSQVKTRKCNRKWWGSMLTPGSGHAKPSVGSRDGTMLKNWDYSLQMKYLSLLTKPDVMIVILKNT